MRLASSILILFIPLLAFEVASPNPIETVVRRLANGVEVQLILSKGYGVQRKAGHKLQLVALQAGHEKEKNLLQKIKQYGKPIAELSQLEGLAAKEDPAYFSQVKPIKLLAPSKGELALFGKIYYCSFVQKFCSVQSIVLPVP